MKKHLPASSVQDQVISLSNNNRRAASKPALFVTRPGPTPVGRRRTVSYVPGVVPRKKQPEVPRLFIRNFGGSIRMDLGGVGVRLSSAVFAHMVADDSLAAIHIYRGDIAVVEPGVRRFHDGNLVMLELDGHAVLRKLKRQKRLWMMDPVDEDPTKSVVLANHGIQGVVLGFVRLFNALRPVRYEGTDANYDTGLEIPASSNRRRQEPPSLLENPRSHVRLAKSLADIKNFFHTHQSGRSRTRLYDVDEPVRQRTWLDKR